MERKNFLIKDKRVYVCCRPWRAPPGGSDGSECHLTSGDSSFHLTGACQQYITTSGRAFAQLFTHILHTDSLTLIYSVYINVFSCVSRARHWWAALCLWLKSRLKAVLCITAVKCAPEPEAWDVCGVIKPAFSQQQSEYEWNITMKWKTSKNQKQRQTEALLG